MMSKKDCSCTVFYLIAERPMCLHKLFAGGYIKAISRETSYDGVEFYIWRDNLVKTKKGRYAGKYKLLGTRSRLSDVGEALLAIDLAKKYNIQKVRL